MMPELLDQIPPDQEVASVTADGALDTRKCHDSIAARGAAAIIPPRRNAKSWTPDTPEPSPATKLCAHHAASAGQPGDVGVGITTEAVSRQRCTV